MEIINGSDRIPGLDRPLFLGLGNFDGVHRGHQAIIKSVISRARREGGRSALLVLNPHPVIALRPENPMALLTDIADRAEIMKELGLDYLILEPFTAELSSYTPERFIESILIDRLSVRGLFVGSNYQFGRDGSGNADTLRYWGNRLGFSVEVNAMVFYRQKRVSSSLIRMLLSEGNVRDAADFLNYYFFRQGKIVRGCGVGRKLVYPTANIIASPRLIWPGDGVYLTAVVLENESPLYGLTNVGFRPTFKSFEQRAVETHILDYQNSLYGQEIRLCFLDKLRDTRLFPSPGALKGQIERDIDMARELIEAYILEKEEKGRSLQVSCSVLRSN